ncbi:thrombospondin type 3 repeat-containing protein [Patescibacteria group bacterium]|nr:thrombospondin type 3 repeat-containing protein [Patescibacteria group bacterium]
MTENQQFDATGGDLEPNQSPNKLNKNQKIAVAGLAIFAVLVVILWFVQLKNNIYGPFNAPVGQNQVASETQNNDEALKAKDTDNDGLNDYDELNIYHTSPYLEDTDGDGFKDGEEIKNNADPNCPKGKTCFQDLLDNSAVSQGASTSGAAVLPDAGLTNLTNQNETLNSLLNQFNASQPATQPVSDVGLSTDQLNALKNIDAASLRQLLLEAGMPKETLDKISDTDLMQSYSETFNDGQ